MCNFSAANITEIQYYNRSFLVRVLYGTTKLYRLEENIGAANVGLSPDDLREIDRTLSGVMIQGDRYPERFQELWRIR